MIVVIVVSSPLPNESGFLHCPTNLIYETGIYLPSGELSLVRQHERLMNLRQYTQRRHIRTFRLLDYVVLKAS